jgi:hypothetical protein
MTLVTPNWHDQERQQILLEWGLRRRRRRRGMFGFPVQNVEGKLKMTRINWRLLVAFLVLLSVAGAATANRGVQEQTIIFPDEIVNHAAFTVRLIAPPVTLKTYGPDHPGTMWEEWVDDPWLGANVHSWKFGNVLLNASKEGHGDAEVACMEHIQRIPGGNMYPLWGVRSWMPLADTLDTDPIKVTLNQLDNPLGETKVELVQKTYKKIHGKFSRNDADNQHKYFYWKVWNKDISGSPHTFIFQWDASTMTANTTGGSLTVNQSGVGGLTWSQTVNQGVDNWEHTAESYHEGNKVWTIPCPLDQNETVERTQFIDAAVQWEVKTEDQNSTSLWRDVSKLKGDFTYYTVIGFGEIWITKNHDGTPANTLIHPGTDIGDPQFTDDRVVPPVVNYVP